MFRLSKIEVEEGKSSALPAGYTSTYPHLSLFDHETGTHKPIDSIKEVDVGWQVVVSRGFGFHNTSKVREIVARGKNKIIFKTQTSVYELEEIHE